MATISSTLKLFDAMSRPLKNVTQGLEKMQKATDQQMGALNIGTWVKKALGNAFKEGLRTIGSLGSDLLKTGINFNASSQSAEVAFTALAGDSKSTQAHMNNILALSGATPFDYPELLTASRNLMVFGMEAKNTLPVINAIGEATVATGGSSQELMQIVDAFGAIQLSGQLTMQEVERLGNNGVNALDILASMAGVTGEEMAKRISAGAVDADTAIAALVEGMEQKFGGAMENYKYTWTGAIAYMMSAWRSAGGELTAPAMESMTKLVNNITGIINRLPTLLGPAVQALIPVIDMLNHALEAGTFDAFFVAASMGLTMVSWGISLVAQGALWLAEIVVEHWPAITAMLLYWGAVLIPILIANLWRMLPPILAQAAAWLLAYWPILLIGFAIGAVIATLLYFGVTAEQIVGFVVGVFAAFFAYLYNKIAFIWNIIVAFAEFLINIFIDPVYAIKKLFYDLASDFLDTMYNMAKSSEDFASRFASTVIKAVNVVIRGINDLIGLLNRLPNFNIKTIPTMSESDIGIVSSSIQNLKHSLKKPTSDRNVVDFSGAKLEPMNINSAFDAGYNAGSGLMNKVGDAFASLNNVPDPKEIGSLPDFSKGLGSGPAIGGAGGNTGMMPKTPNIGEVDKVNEVGRINDTVDISSEDLKLLRELAEMKNIQNFVSLTPTVQVKTGDIKEEADVHKLIKGIERVLEDQIASSAKGVYV